MCNTPTCKQDLPRYTTANLNKPISFFKRVHKQSVIYWATANIEGWTRAGVESVIVITYLVSFFPAPGAHFDN